eukprot:TRINITY_DN34401_c0_g2_i1.p1 TRINITY_DN34401_c0_g2~~TRINITY_DN34401_c0_g2_i1.p1  ORF type:complete len:115 (-),score=8.37 TRINITY_DN34401_c0_g2_i1:1815-2159(-)
MARVHLKVTSHVVLIFQMVRIFNGVGPTAFHSSSMQEFFKLVTERICTLLIKGQYSEVTKEQERKKKSMDMRKIQCYSCKEYGYIANQCKKRFYSYCKKMGFLNSDCRKCTKSK